MRVGVLTELQNGAAGRGGRQAARPAAIPHSPRDSAARPKAACAIPSRSPRGRTTSLSGDSAPYGRAIPSRSPRGPCKRRKGGKRRAAGGRWRFSPAVPYESKLSTGRPAKNAAAFAAAPFPFLSSFAVSEGFEPPIRSHVHLFSRQAPSTTRTTHQSYPGAKIQKFRQKRKKVKDAPGMGGNLPGEGEPFHAGDYSGRVVPGASLM